MIRVRYKTVPDLVGVEAVAVRLADGLDLRVGYVRNDRLGTWVARLRPGVPTPHEDGVRAFSSRTAAATWLLTTGGFAQPADRARSRP
jgi:hypothetical protein